MDDKLNKIHQYLLSQNIENLPSDYNGFVALMEDDNKAAKVHSYLLSQNIENVDADFNVFSDYVGRKKKVPTEDSGLPSFGLPQENIRTSQKPLEDVLTPQQPLPSAEEPKESGFVRFHKDLARSLGSASLRALGGITGVPQFVNRTVASFTTRPFVKAMGGTDEDARLYADALIAGTPTGQVTLGGEKAQQRLNQEAQKIEAKIKPIEDNIVTNVKEGNYGQAGELLARGVVQSLPYLAMTFATSGGGSAAVLGTIGATAASQQYSELDGKVPEGKKIVNSWLYGGFEAAGELFTASLADGIKIAFKSGISDVAKDNLIKGAAKTISKAFFGEGASEAATQIGQNLTDIVTGTDPNRKIFDNVIDAALIGGVSGGGLGTIQVGASLRGRAMASDKEVKQVQDNVNQQKVLIDQIEQTDSDPVKNALKRSIKDLKVQADEIMDTNYELATKLSPEKQAQVAELYSVWNELQAKIDNKEVTEQEVPALESTIKGIKDQIQGIKDELVTQLEEEAKAKETGETVKKETVTEPAVKEAEVITEPTAKAPYVEINSENISEIENNELTSLREQGATEEEIASVQKNINLIKQSVNERVERERNPLAVPTEDRTGEISVIRPEEIAGDEGALGGIFRGRRDGNRAEGRITPEEQVKNTLAPNGQKSNLSPELHSYVRTPEFIQKFGNWQEGEGSLVLDRNGEPLLVYSGKGKYHERGLDPTKTQQKILFFTGDRMLAKDYAQFGGKQPTIYRGFVRIGDTDLQEGSQINNLHEGQQEFIITKKEQFIPIGIEEVPKIKKERKVKPKETGGQTDAQISRTEDTQVTKQGAPELVGQESDGGGVRYNEQVKPIEEEIAPQNFTTKEVIDRDYNILKEKLGEKKAQKYFQQVDRLFNPNQNNIVEYRQNGVVVKDGDKYTFHALSGMDTKEWRVAFQTDVTDQFVQKPAEFTELEQAPKIEQTEPKEAISATQETGEVTPPPPPQKPVETAEKAPSGKTRTREIGAKVIESANVKQEVKDALLENGIDYVPRGQKYTLSELQEIVDMFSTNEDGLDKLAETVYDVKNDIEGDTRVTLNVYIADKYSKLLDEATDPKIREKYRNKLADAFIFGQEFATKAGQTVEALKRWRELLSRDPESIIAIRKRQQSKYNEFALAGMEGDIKSAKEILDSIVNTEEFKQIIESEVNKEIDKIANKKYGEVDKKKINDFFDGLLVKNDKAFDATVGIPIAVYNGAILVIKKAVLAGVDITNAIKQAVDYIDEWYKKNYAEGKIHSPEWNKDDYMAQMDKQLKPLSKKVKKVKHKVSKAVEESLVDKIYAKMSTATKPQLRRLVREYITTLDAEGAISEQRFKDLFAKAIGLDVLTPEDEQKIRETALSLKNSTKVAEKLVAKFKELVAETDNARIKELEAEIKTLKKEANKAKFEALKAARKLEGLMTDKATLGSTFHTLIQGNLLTPISLISNVVGNTVFLPVRNASYMVASGMDMIVSKLATAYTPLLQDPWVKANPRVRRLIESLPTPSREYDYFASVRGYWYGMPKGLEEGIRQIWAGTLPEDQYQQYIGQGLNPWKAAQRLRDQLTGKEQIAFDTAMANFLEAFPTTYMAEAFFRTLNLGDKPFRRAAERSRLEEIATLKGLKGNQRDAFINNPDPDSVEEARKAGDVAVYQQDTVISEMFSWLNKRINRVAAQRATKRPSVIVSTVGALLKATQAPYVKTPVNLIGEAIDYSIPSLSLGRAIYYAFDHKEGNKRKSYEYFGKAAVGYMLMNIAFFLIREGLLSPPTDDDEKIRQAQYDAKPGYSLNLDALWRKIDPFDHAKGNSEWKEGDKVMNIQRLGVFSMILMGMSKAYAELPPDEMQKDITFRQKGEYGLRMIPTVVGASLEQSFLSGTASGIKAFTEGGPAFDKWAISTSKALSAVIYPNTLAQISQVFFDDNYIREVKDMYSRDEKFKKQIINTFKDRTFMGKDLPAKVTLWGEKVNRVPEGESWAHVMFDVTRSVEYQKSSFGVRMFEWWERYRFIDETEAKKILPSIPSASNTVGWDDRNMTAKEVEEFQIAVGQRRKSYVENIMNSAEWQDMSDEEKIVELERIYRTQASKVKAGMFMLDVIKADNKVFKFLDENDLIPIPTKTITIKHQRDKIKLTPEQTAEYYSNVQRHFVERMNNSGLADRELTDDEKSKDRLVKQVNSHWDRAKEIASRDWITSKKE